MKIQHLSSKFSDYDLFAVQPSFKIKGKDQMASVMGLFLTLFTILSMIALSLYLIVQMIEHTNPNVTNSEVVTNVYNGDSVTISKNNNASFYFAFALFAEDVITDPAILNITVQANNYTVIPPGQIIPQNSCLSAELCDWYENYGDWDTQGTQGYCIDQDFTLLSGMPGPDHAAKQSLTISFSPCSATSGLAACKDPENIENIMSNSEFRVTYTNPSINNNDYKDPVVMNYIDYEEYILPGYTKTLTFFITKVKVVTDNGWFFQSTHEVDAIFVEDQRTTIQPRKSEDSPLFNFVITANDKVLVYNRSYNKIQDVFGEITGLASFIVLVITVFARPYFQFKTTEALVNSVYDVVVKEDAFSSTIGIIDQNSGKDNDKKDDPENDEKQNLKKRNQSFSTRCKSKKVGIEQNITRTSTSSILTSETPKSSNQKKDGIEQNLTRSNSILPSETPKSSNQIKNVHKRQEQPESGDLEICRQETFAGLLKKATGEDPPIIEIETETGEQKQDDHPLRSSLLLEPRYKIDVSFGEWLLSFFRPQLQVKILQEAEETLARNLDLISLSQNMAEINKLKECILNDQQRILFDNLPHSFMKLESNSKSSKDEEEGERCGSLEGNKEGRLKEAYTKLKESQNKSELDLKLLHLYEKKYSKF